MFYSNMLQVLQKRSKKEMKLRMKEGLIVTRNLSSYRTFRAKKESNTDLHF